MKKTTITFGFLGLTLIICALVFFLILFERNKKIVTETLPCDDCKLYYNQKEKIAFYSPSSWVVEDLKPFDMLEPFVRLSDQNNSTIYIGGPNVFSTSGAICIDPGRLCGEPLRYDLTIMGQSYYLDLIGLYPVDPSTNSIRTDSVPDFYRFQLEIMLKKGDGQINLVITGQIPDAIYLETVLQIISSIQTR